MPHGTTVKSTLLFFHFKVYLFGFYRIRNLIKIGGAIMTRKTGFLFFFSLAKNSGFCFGLPHNKEFVWSSFTES